MTRCTVRVHYLVLFPRKHIEGSQKFLPPRLYFEVKITDLDYFHELKCRLCADGSRMAEGIDLVNSYTPTADADSLRLVIALVVTYCLDLTLYDVSNDFQTNIISDPAKRHYLSIPPLYQKWFKYRWLQNQDNWKKLVLQTLRNMQGTKDAGYEFYLLFSNVFLDLEMVANTLCKGVFIWRNNKILLFFVVCNKLSRCC